MKIYKIKKIFLIVLVVLSSNLLFAQEHWPLELESTDWNINIYQPINESFEGNILKSRCAISLKFTNSDEPVFGAMWVESKLVTDKNKRTATLESIKITGLKFPEAVESSTISRCKKIIEYEIPKLAIPISLDKMLSTLEYSEQEIQAASSFKNDPPEIIISNDPALLVVVDGEPKYEKVEGYKYERIVNTPFFIIKDSKKYYIYNSNGWLESNSLSGEWSEVEKLNSDLKKLDTELKKNLDEENVAIDSAYAAPKVFVRKTPAELLLIEGEPNFASIEGTTLLYVKNSNDNIFRTIDSQKYYVLISGRWFQSSSLNGPWKFEEAKDIPKEFSKIPEGSEKDIILSSIPGTNAAQEALLESQIPQTAAVEKATASTEVTYDGDPKFEKIEGTSLAYAKNTSSTVILTGDKKYFVCDNGVWFTGSGPKGPWQVSTEVPPDVEKIPASSPVYNVKYVYIYETTPTVVYTGYTPGYLGCYTYGPTVVYGTGYYYSGWYGTYYYPRPVTYGFNFHYNPYSGWSMGFSMSFGGPHGYMNYGYGSPYHHGGWWGPPVYRPPYYHRPPYGYYGNRPVHYGNTNVNINRNNNIYVNRGNGISTGNRPAQGVRPSTGQKPAGRPSTGQQPAGKPSTGQQPTGRPSNGQQPAGRPSTGQQPAGRPSTSQQPTNRPNNVYTDKSGNVYRNNNNSWERNNGSNWQSAKPSQNNLNQMQDSRNRGNTRYNNSNSYTRPQSSPQHQSRPATRPQPSRAPSGGRRR